MVSGFRYLFILLLSLGLSGCSSYLERTSHRLSQQPYPRAYALVGVNLIPIEPAGLLARQTVLVKDGLILEIGPQDQIGIPDGFEEIPLAGKYLLPGFADMHVHLAQEQDLIYFLRHGITQVRNMADSTWWGKLAGFPHVPALRDKVRREHWPAPDIFTCGAMLDGNPAQNFLTTPIANPAQAAAAVRQTVQQGFDCVKIYNRLNLQNFWVIVKEAKKYQIPVMGHVPIEVGLEEALKAKVATIEHLNAYLDNFAGGYRIPAERWHEYAQRTAQAGVYNCPTLVMWDHHPDYNNPHKLEQDPRYKRIPGHLRLLWDVSVPELFNVTFPDKAAYPSTLLAQSKPMVKALYEGGAPLLIGTDANLTGVFPGRTALREMELFAEAGIPNQGILQAATLNAARVLKKDQLQGSIKVGKQADLVVLDANPLEDIRHVYQTYGVMRQGRWWTLPQLEQMAAQAEL